MDVNVHHSSNKCKRNTIGSDFALPWAVQENQQWQYKKAPTAVMQKLYRDSIKKKMEHNSDSIRSTKAIKQISISNTRLKGKFNYILNPQA